MQFWELLHERLSRKKLQILLLFFFYVLQFSPLPFLAFVVNVFPVLCCSSLAFSAWMGFCILSSYTFSYMLALFHRHLALSLPLFALPLLFATAHSSDAKLSVLVEKCHLLNSLGEILVSLKLVAKFPLTLVWPGFHPLALKCSALLRASTSASSALLQAVWLHQKLEQKEWCYGATALGRSFLAVKYHVSSPMRDLCDKFIWVPELLCLSDWASFASHFIFLVLFSFDVWLL